jgi:hypothetical protein
VLVVGVALRVALAVGEGGLLRVALARGADDGLALAVDRGVGVTARAEAPAVAAGAGGSGVALSAATWASSAPTCAWLSGRTVGSPEAARTNPTAPRPTTVAAAVVATQAVT